MKAKVTGVTAWQGTPTGGTLSIRAPRYVDSSGNASPEEYSAVLDVTHNPPRWMDALDPTRELYVIVQGPDDLPGVRGRFYEVLHYGPTKSVRTEFTRKLISSDLSGLIFDYAMPEPTDIPVGFGDAPLTMRAAQQVIEEGGAVVSEWSDIKVDIAQSEAQLLAAAGRIPHSGGDHTTLPNGAGDYLLTRGAAAGQVWTRATNGAAPTRNVGLESESPATAARGWGTPLFRRQAALDGVTDDSAALQAQLTAERVMRLDLGATAVAGGLTVAGTGRRTIDLQGGILRAPGGATTTLLTSNADELIISNGVLDVSGVAAGLTALFASGTGRRVVLDNVRIIGTPMVDENDTTRVGKIGVAVTNGELELHGVTIIDAPLAVQVFGLTSRLYARGLRISGYRTGLYASQGRVNVSGLDIEGGVTATRNHAGWDGVLLENCAEIIMSDGVVRGAPEHGIYISDLNGAVTPSLNMGRLTVTGSYGYGVKINAARGVVDSLDCSANGAHGLAILSARNVRLGSVVANNNGQSGVVIAGQNATGVPILRDIAFGGITANENGHHGVEIYTTGPTSGTDTTTPILNVDLGNVEVWRNGAAGDTARASGVDVKVGNSTGFGTGGTIRGIRIARLNGGDDRMAGSKTQRYNLKTGNPASGVTGFQIEMNVARMWADSTYKPVAAWINTTAAQALERVIVHSVGDEDNSNFWASAGSTHERIGLSTPGHNVKHTGAASSGWVQDSASLGGSGTIASGSTSVTVSNAYAKTTSQILVSATSNGGLSAYGLRVSAKNAGNFVVSVDGGTPTAGLTFDWTVINNG